MIILKFELPNEQQTYLQECCLFTITNQNVDVDGIKPSDLFLYVHA